MINGVVLLGTAAFVWATANPQDTWEEGTV